MSGVSDRLMRAALKYAEQFGFAVFPCHYSIAAAEGLRCSCGRRDCASPGKHPFTAHGLKDATKKPEVVADWWKKRLRANVAIATGTTSRIVVLDIDSRHGGDETLTALEGKYGKLPATPMVRTGSGGRHFFFKHPGGRVPNSAGRLGRGLDQRGDGGYIIGPPSLHLSGNHYTWGQSSRIDEIALADAPDWLLTWSVPLPAIRDKSAPEGRFDSLQPSAHRLDLARLAAGIAEGERDTELFRLACYLRRRGYTREQALRVVLDAAGRCSPPFLPAAAQAKVHSAWRYA